MMGTFYAFTHPSFRLLWFASLIIQINYWFATITFQWVLPHSTDADGLKLGALYFWAFLPYLLFSLLTGALADKYDRRRILLISQSLAIGLGATCTALAAAGMLSPPVVYALGFAGGCIVVLLSPASQAFTANTVPTEHLSGAIAMQSVSLNLARISGPVLAGAALLLGVAGAFSIYAGLALLALVLLGRIRPVQLQQRSGTEAVLSRVRAGIAHARIRRPSMATLALVGLAAAFGSAYQAQLPILGARIAEDGDRAFLALVLIGGIGSLVGVVMVTRRTRQDRLPQLRTVAGGLIVLGAAESLMGLVHSYPAMLALVTIGGAALFWTMTCANILLQHLIDDAQRGRVMSLYLLCWGGLIPVGGIGIGAAITRFGSPWAFAGVGLAALSGAFVVLVWDRVVHGNEPTVTSPPVIAPPEVGSAPTEGVHDG